MSQFNMYKTKKKRAVDPNAPPRPNLLSHEKVLKDTKLNLDQQAEQIQQLKLQVDQLTTKLSNQNAYLSQLHQYVHSKLKS